jgi:hypothetical protein
MGIFTSIGGLFSPRIKKYQRSIKNLEKQRAATMVANADRALEWQAKEDPRQLAHQKQAMFGRGLGKSSIYDQDKERLEMLQSHRQSRLKEQQTYAYAYKKMIRRKHDYEKVNKYMQILDSIVSIAAGAGGGPSQDANYSGDAGIGGAYSGAAGGSYYGGGGGGGYGAASGGYSGAYGGSYY